MCRPQVRCVEFVGSVTEWMEGGLGEAQRMSLEEHLVICSRCAEYLAQLRMAISVLAAAPAPASAPPPAAREALLAEFRRARA